MNASFDRRGFYLHASWQYDYPFAVRTWSRDDYAGMFKLLRSLGLNRVMIWPMTELAPPPMSEDDRRHFHDFRRVIEDARDTGLECWLVFCANLTTTVDVRGVPFKDRVFYPNKRTLRLDVPVEFDAYMTHLADILGCLNNADGYVFIDGDPGGYAGAQPAEFLRMLQGVRDALDRVAVGRRPKVVPWVWSGWGAHGDEIGDFWNVDLREFVRPFLAALKQTPPAEPWELLPGRSVRDGHANGRINFALAEEAGLLDRSTLLTYEIIEFEPTPPGFVDQLSDIRRVIREELPLAGQVRGIMGNAQQPICGIHNLFYFARCASDPAWLDKSDEEALSALAEFLGGPKELLVPAWRSGHLDLHEIPEELPARLRDCALTSECARMIPGGPALYLDLLAEFVAARRTVLEQTRDIPGTVEDAEDRLVHVAMAFMKWWSRHHYVLFGDKGPGFRWRYIHWALMKPYYEWIRQVTPLVIGARESIVARLAGSGYLTEALAQANVDDMFSWKDR